MAGRDLMKVLIMEALTFELTADPFTLISTDHLLGHTIDQILAWSPSQQRTNTHATIHAHTLSPKHTARDLPSANRLGVSY